ncbi:MAG TPA: Re/Si-specific NAD(P)(+) transhydrogenase subunit alpha [Phycisphaerae bacterium]|nr:Re/Si-specific NAD(P)(+) transhydrogenase subunit alpha [Phycisphaerae bacterium]
MIVGVPKETYPNERRVALVPAAVSTLMKKGLGVSLEAGAGVAAGFPDQAYVENGASIAPSRTELFESANILVQVRAGGANPDRAHADLDLLRADQVVIGFFEPLAEPEALIPLAERQLTTLAMELMPRITRAQSMDALSSMATIAGYKAVLMAADALNRMFPMLMTAAGTIAPARVLVVGAGVAGLQAIATARRLGAVVSAYDIRAAVKEQVESLGARFVELAIDAGDAEDASGYAKTMHEAFYRRQGELMARTVAEANVVITTAAVPGKKAPVLITDEMVAAMQPGSVIVDLAAERGGNCQLTKPGKTVTAHDVTVVGPLNLPSTVPYHASQMYARNITTFLLHLMDGGSIKLDVEDQITRETLLTHDGRIVHPHIQALLDASASAPNHS